jgi:hypothetical protein
MIEHQKTPTDHHNRAIERHEETLVARVDHLSGRLKQTWAFVVGALLASAIIFSGELVRAVKDLREFFAPGPDALALAEQKSKDDISRDFVETTSRRIYLSRNFLARLRRHAGPSEIDETWKKLLSTIEDMTAKQMVYAVTFGEFYSEERRNEYENGIQVDFNELTSKLVDLRYSTAAKKLEFSAEPQLQLTDAEAKSIDDAAVEIESELDQLQIRLYIFDNCFAKRTAKRTSPSTAVMSALCK